MYVYATRILILILFLAGFTHSQSLKESALSGLSRITKPQSMEEFKPVFHFPPLNQDTTNACWSFSTLSFIESEMKRLRLEPVKLSVMYPVYFSFVEKARRYVRTKGKSRFGPGDLFTGVIEIIKKYGIIPQSEYRGQTPVYKTYNHTSLESELDGLMKKIKEIELWDEEIVITKTRQILDKHLDRPPRKFIFNNENYSPESFLKEIVRLPWEEYVTVTSFMYAPFYQSIELKVPDNWMHYDNFYNVPLDQFYNSLKSAVQNGFSVAFDSDTGEPGRIGSEDVVFVPEFDIPSRFINQEAREFRFKNKSTTDDHLMHIIGHKEIEGNDWFLVKDSWRTAWEGRHKGYYFFHGDYIKLKVLAFLVHKDGINE